MNHILLDPLDNKSPSLLWGYISLM